MNGISHTTLKSKHEGMECEVLACGPSLREYEKQKVLDFLEGKIVICVKEAVLDYKDQCDYFLFNDTRLREYDFNPKTIKVYQSSETKKCPISWDIKFKEDKPFTKETQLLKIKNFDKYDISKNSLRPWGPGILYETVFYMCMYMGIKTVYTIGWDLTDGSAKIDHFFENDKSTLYSKSQKWSDADCAKHKFDEEMAMVNRSVPDLYDYFFDKGMDIVVIGQKSFVNSHIPRLLL